MRNRAKCKLCKQIIESKTEHDTQQCPCGEISISGGDVFYKAAAKDFDNFLRVDDDGKEIEVTVRNKEESELAVEPPKPLSLYVDKLSELLEIVSSLQGKSEVDSALVLIYSMLQELNPSSEESPASP